jgi:iron complex transport system substrate-binding protein
MNTVHRRTLIVLVACALLAGCGGGASSSSSDGEDGDGWTFTDDLGVEIRLDNPPERIVAQVSAAATLWDYGVRPVGVFGPQQREDGTPESVFGDIDPAAVESVGEGFEEFNVEALAALRPDLIVTVTYEETMDESSSEVYWYVPDESLDEIQAVAPILAIGIAAEPLDTTLARFAELAEALGADIEAPEFAAEKERFDTASGALTAATKTKPGLSTTFISGTPEGLFVVHPEASADVRMFRKLGLEVVTPNTPVEEFWEQLSWENAGAHPADLIFNDVRKQAMTTERMTGERPTFAALPAVRAGQVAPWYFEQPYSYQRYATVLEDLTKAVESADPAVVP